MLFLAGNTKEEDVLVIGEASGNEIPLRPRRDGEKVARRFNAGSGDLRRIVPEGRVSYGKKDGFFNRPDGTRFRWKRTPALKRRATLGLSLRDESIDAIRAIRDNKPL